MKHTLLLWEIEMQNFGPFEDIKVNLNKLNLTFVLGRNGSGKSTLFESITFALYGYGFKGGKKERTNYIRRKQEQPARVTLTMRNATHYYRIRRSVDHQGTNRVLLQKRPVDGTEWESATAGVRDVQTQVEELIGMSYESFTAIHFMTQDKENDFATLRNGKRLESFFEVFGLTHWQEKRQRANEAIRAIGEQIALVSQRMDDKRNQLKSEGDLLEQEQQIQAQTKTAEETLTGIEAVLNQIDVKVQAYRLLEAQIENQQQKISAYEKEYNLTFREWNELKGKRKTTEDAIAHTKALLENKEVYLLADQQASIVDAALQSYRERGRLATDLQNSLHTYSQLQQKENSARANMKAQKELKAQQLLTNAASQKKRLDANKEAIQVQYDALASLRDLMGQASAIEAAYAESQNLQSAIKLLQEEMSRRTALSKQLAGFKQRQADEKLRLQAKLSELQTQEVLAAKQSSILDEVPCKGEGTLADCPLIANAVDSRNKLGSLAEQIAALRSEALPFVQDIAALNREIELIDAKVAGLDALQNQLQELQPLARLVPALRAAAEKQTHAQGLIESLEAENKAIIADNRQDKEAWAVLRAEIEALDAQPETYRASIASLEEKLQDVGYQPAEEAALQKQLDTLKKSAAKLSDCRLAEGKISGLARLLDEQTVAVNSLSGKLEEQQQGICYEKDALKSLETEFQSLKPWLTKQKEAQNQLKDTHTKLTGLASAAGKIQERLSMLEAVKAELAPLEAQFKTLAKEKRQHEIIAKVCEQTPVYMIENILPEVERYANLLLLKMNNGQNRISLDTQGEYKNGNIKDRILEINIEEGTETVPFKTYSGEERFAISYALRGAMAKVAAARRSDGGLGFFIIDEGIAVADNVNRRVILDTMIGLSSEFDQLFVATHIDELKEMAPQRIEIQRTLEGATIEVAA